MYDTAEPSQLTRTDELTTNVEQTVDGRAAG